MFRLLEILNYKIVKIKRSIGKIIMLGGCFIMFLFNRKSIVKITGALSLLFLVGCTNSQKSSLNSDANKVKNDVNNISSKTYINGPKKNQKNNSAQNVVLADIRTYAIQGKVINSDYTIKNTNITSVQKMLGKPDSSTWIASAKGLYSTYSKHNIVFGSNKGGQIFEIRSLDPKLNKISLSMVKSNFGTPKYDVKTGGRETIGYTAGDQFKILFVFPEPTKSNPDPLMSNYSVLYPAGTVNSMANDRGRQW